MGAKGQAVPKIPIKCLTCDFPIFQGLEDKSNDNLHAICASDNGLTITERRKAVEIASRELLIQRSDDFQARVIMLKLAEELVVQPDSNGDWQSKEQQQAIVKLQKAMIYMEDRAAYQEHVESGEVLQMNDLGERRWAYPGEAR